MPNIEKAYHILLAAAEALDFPAGVRVGEDTRTSMQNDELVTSAIAGSLASIRGHVPEVPPSSLKACTY